MNVFRRGHLYWTRMPGEHKLRPGLVVSPDRRNERSHTVVMVPCTSVIRLGPWHVLLRKGEGGLSLASVLKCEDIGTVAKVNVEAAPIGASLGEARLREVREGILRALDFDL
jgi:mRNA-degrading endonuclease toxin of MazEF toxin-antitoxin module